MASFLPGALFCAAIRVFMKQGGQNNISMSGLHYEQPEPPLN